ncbi:hypothetical protein [uncultured Microscilla sp.]|uniref:hypothetical protein n=1 Tax=uncultured Microscilla sp. TaxID=432653 RepID=UPI002625EC90|nr:hypothetical protein [uncultured Microscilla sp.]
MENTHLSALIAYTTTVNTNAVVTFLNSYSVQIPESVSTEAIKQYVIQAIAENDGALEAFLDLHPEREDFATNIMNSSQPASTSNPTITTEKYWNEKRIKISVLVSLMIGLAVLLAIKFE